MLMRYETLYFQLYFQPRQKPRNICDPSLLSAITLECFTVKLIFQVKSQLRLVGSNNTGLGAVAHGALELDLFQIRKCLFLVSLECLDISSKKRCL